SVLIRERYIELLIEALDPRIAVAERNGVQLVETTHRVDQTYGRIDHHGAMHIEFVFGRVERFDDGRVGAPEAVAENIDVGDLNLVRKTRNDPLHRCIEIAAILQKIARD